MSLSYQQTAAPEVLWPEPMESVWQMQPGGYEADTNWKRPDITLSDRLFIGGVVNIPGDQRPWGSITWLSNIYQTSRETIYAIGKRARAGLLSPVLASSDRVIPSGFSGAKAAKVVLRQAQDDFC